MTTLTYFMMVSFNGYGLQEQSVKPMQDKGEKHEGDKDGKDYVFHAIASSTCGSSHIRPSGP